MSTKERIFAAALDLFAEKGFKATSIREITGKTGLSVAAFYNHFKSKNELLQAVYDYYTERYKGADAGQTDYGKLLEQISPMALFEQMNQQIVATLRNETLVKLTRVIVNEQLTNKTAGEIAGKDRQVLVESMEQLFAAMHAKGLIQADNPQALGRFFGYAYLGFSLDNIAYSILGDQDPQVTVDAETDLVRSVLQEFMKK